MERRFWWKSLASSLTVLALLACGAPPTAPRCEQIPEILSPEEMGALESVATQNIMVRTQNLSLMGSNVSLSRFETVAADDELGHYLCSAYAVGAGEFRFFSYTYPEADPRENYRGGTVFLGHSKGTSAVLSILHHFERDYPSSSLLSND